MNFNHVIKKQEIIDFHLKYISSTNIYKKSVTIMLLIWWLGTILVIKAFSNIFFTFFAFISIFICSLLRKKIALLKLKKLLTFEYSRLKHKNLFENTIITINQNGIKLSTNLCDKLYTWKGVKSIHVLDNYLFIQTYLSDDFLINLKNIPNIKVKNLIIENCMDSLAVNISYNYPVNIKLF